MANEHSLRQVHDLLLAAKPEGAKHDADICTFCVESASQATASGPPDVSDQSTEGGATPTMSGTETQMISQETHEALVSQKVATAIAQSDQALATASEKASTAEARVSELETELSSVKEENSKLSSDLDAAQVDVKSLTEERDQLKEDAAKAVTDKEQADKASERAKQVTNLKLFTEDYVTEKAQKWAKLSDEDWAEQVETWKTLKPAGDGVSTETGGDTASVMTGGDGVHTADSTTDSAGEKSGEKKPVPARRAALGLGAN